MITLDCLHGAEYFASVDFRDRYWQINVDKVYREKTAFITPNGFFEFKVIPFGLCNAPATFKRMMDCLLKGLKWTVCMCYLDDVIIFSDSFSSHLDRLVQVLQIFRGDGLQLNSSKGQFGRRQVEISGHLFDENRIQPHPEKINAVHNFSFPQSPKTSEDFLSLSFYFRRFIGQFAQIA